MFIDDIIAESGNDNVVVRQLDLASLKSVRKFAAEILKSEKRLDVLINNAGCALTERKLTEDGLEYQMQTNHFGHFLLTNLLLGTFDYRRQCSLFNLNQLIISYRANYEDRRCANHKCKLASSQVAKETRYDRSQLRT